MNSLMILGAGPLQVPLIERGRALGLHTIALDRDSKAIGFSTSHEYEVVDISDVGASLAYARRRRPDAVVTAATDHGVLAAAAIAHDLNLQGLDFNIAQLVKNKGAVRGLLGGKNVVGESTYLTARTLNDIDVLESAASFPLMVKPTDGSGSQGVSRVDAFEQLALAVNDAINHSRRGEAVIETFYDGNEYGIEAFVYGGKIEIVSVLRKQMTSAPRFAELGHTVCSQPEIVGRVAAEARRAIKALGIQIGAVNLDALDTPAGVVVIDIGARMGGNLIGSHIVPLSTGIDHVGNIIRASLGAPPKYPRERSCIPVATRILALSPGRLRSLPDLRRIEIDLDVQILHHLEVGKEILPYRNNLDGQGYVVATGSSEIECETRAASAHDLIERAVRGSLE